MYKLLAAAIVSIFMIIFVFSFAPGTRRKSDKPKKEKPVIENNEINVSAPKKVTDLMSANVNSDEKVNFKKLSVPRGDAASHGMDEKFFEEFPVTEYQTMNRNLEEKLVSISNARVKSAKAKKYGANNE
jgi:hypothetical protein